MPVWENNIGGRRWVCGCKKNKRVREGVQSKTAVKSKGTGAVLAAVVTTSWCVGCGGCC